MTIKKKLWWLILFLLSKFLLIAMNRFLNKKQTRNLNTRPHLKKHDKIIGKPYHLFEIFFQIIVPLILEVQSVLLYGHGKHKFQKIKFMHLAILSQVLLILQKLLKKLLKILNIILKNMRILMKLCKMQLKI